MLRSNWEYTSSEISKFIFVIITVDCATSDERIIVNEHYIIIIIHFRIMNPIMWNGVFHSFYSFITPPFEKFVFSLIAVNGKYRFSWELRCWWCLLALAEVQPISAIAQRLKEAIVLTYNGFSVSRSLGRINTFFSYFLSYKSIHMTCRYFKPIKKEERTTEKMTTDDVDVGLNDQNANDWHLSMQNTCHYRVVTLTFSHILFGLSSCILSTFFIFFFSCSRHS